MHEVAEVVLVVEGWVVTREESVVELVVAESIVAPVMLVEDEVLIVDLLHVTGKVEVGEIVLTSFLLNVAVVTDENQILDLDIGKAGIPRSGDETWTSMGGLDRESAQPPFVRAPDTQFDHGHAGNFLSENWRLVSQNCCEEDREKLLECGADS